MSDRQTHHAPKAATGGRLSAPERGSGPRDAAAGERAADGRTAAPESFGHHPVWINAGYCGGIEEAA